MSILGSIFGGGAVSSIISALGTVVDQIFTSEEERQQAKYLLKKLEQEPYILQAEINKVEARHKSIFVAGWRPWLGWVCGMGMAFAFLISPILTMFGFPVPNIPLEVMYNLTLAMLGLGAFRTYEKIRGVASHDLKLGQPEVDISGLVNRIKKDLNIEEKEANKKRTPFKR